jgi:hypothetical protein
VGNSHFCIFARLYHVILERLSAAKTMASKAAATNGAEEPPPKEDKSPRRRARRTRRSPRPARRPLARSCWPRSGARPTATCTRPSS